MSNLTLHFTPDANSDPQLLADQLLQKLITLPDVTDVRTEVPLHDLHDSPSVVGSVTLLQPAMDDLDKVAAGLKHVAESTKGLGESFVVVGERQIALLDLTVDDLKSATSSASDG